jgi:hypothetical protein
VNPTEIENSLALAATPDTVPDEQIMTHPQSESVSITIARDYGNHKSRVQHGIDLSAAISATKTDAEAGVILVAEVARLQRILRDRERASAAKQG